MSYEAIYDELNNQGEGFAVGSENDDINEFKGFGKLVRRSSSDAEVAVYFDGKVCTLVGNANGPWAVQFETEDVD